MLYSYCSQVLFVFFYLWMSIFITSFTYLFIMLIKMVSKVKIVLIAVYFVLCMCVQSNNLSIHESLFGLSLKGEWRISNNKKDIMGMINYDKKANEANKSEQLYLSFFNNTKGHAYVLITQAQQNSKKPHFYIQLMNSNYINDRVIEFSFVLEKGFNRTLNQWKSPRFMTATKLFDNFNQLITFDIKTNFQMKKNANDQIQITIISDSINVDLFMQPAKYGFSYFVALTIVNIVQIVLLVYFGGNQTTLANTSQWLLLQSCLFLAFQSIFMFKIALGYYDTKLSWLFLNFVTNISVMMLVLWRFTAVIQKFKNKLQFFMALVFIVAYFTLVYYYYTYGLFWVIESMLFLWQISYSILRGGAGGVSFELVLVIILSRIPLLITMKSQDNLLRLKPDVLAFKFIIACMIIHLITIWCQKKFGARFFTPVKLIPNYFNYIREDYFNSQIASIECSICLNRLRQSPNSATKSQEQSQREAEEKKDEKIKYVFTKCKHYYHQKCLHDWLSVHLVCPLCKSDLPPMDLGTS